MRVLYLTNIHNPYRDVFFEELGRRCELTVLFERHSDSHRDASWFDGAHANSYREVFLPDKEGRFRSKTMLSMLGEGGLVVAGCYNEPRQMAAIAHMRRKGIPYVVNLDGPLFDTSLPKRIVRDWVLRGASAYLVAGNRSVSSLRDVAQNAPVAAYPFSSLTAAQIAKAASGDAMRDPRLVLSVGQFEPYKGLDVLLSAARELPHLQFRIVGAGRRDDELKHLVVSLGLANIDTIPFLSPHELAHEYERASLFVLPSRQECWGLVVNEAASHGTPLVSTWGSGAAVEFLSETYPKFLAEPDDPSSLANCIRAAFALGPQSQNEYSLYLRQKASEYTIETMVDAHMSLFEQMQDVSHG